MKRIIYILLLLQVCLISSCSSDDDSSGSNEVSQKLMGKWYFSDPEGNDFYDTHYFLFTSNSKVTYSYGPDEFDSETGNFEVEGDILTMVFPETVTLTYVQKVVFVDDNTVQFVQVEDSNEEPYDGTYYRAE